MSTRARLISVCQRNSAPAAPGRASAVAVRLSQSRARAGGGGGAAIPGTSAYAKNQSPIHFSGLDFGFEVSEGEGCWGDAG